jgi:tetratricopeptide (TPR) repeat protein
MLWQGERAEAQKLADELVPHFRHMAMDVPQPLGTDAMIRTFTAVRFSDWDAVLAVPDGDLPVASLATHYARGLALVAKGRLDDAQREIELLETTTMKNSPDGYRGRLIKVARIAHEHVSAAILVAQQQPDQAVEVMRKAVEMEDHLDNPLEPELWIFSSRERLGALFLRVGRYQEAADMFRADLPRHPENGWSLFGLMTALEALHDPEAPAIRKRFEKAWARSDFKLTPDRL